VAALCAPKPAAAPADGKAMETKIAQTKPAQIKVAQVKLAMGPSTVALK
jgi:hypothetical protein